MVDQVRAPDAGAAERPTRGAGRPWRPSRPHGARQQQQQRLPGPARQQQHATEPQMPRAGLRLLWQPACAGPCVRHRSSSKAARQAPATAAASALAGAGGVGAGRGGGSSRRAGQTGRRRGLVAAGACACRALGSDDSSGRGSEPSGCAHITRPARTPARMRARALQSAREALKAKLKSDPSFRKELRKRVADALLAKGGEEAQTAEYNFDSYMLTGARGSSGWRGRLRDEARRALMQCLLGWRRQRGGSMCSRRVRACAAAGCSQRGCIAAALAVAEARLPRHAAPRVRARTQMWSPASCGCWTWTSAWCCRPTASSACWSRRPTSSTPGRCRRWASRSTPSPAASTR